MIRPDRKNDSDQSGFAYHIYDGPDRRSGLDRRNCADRRGLVGIGQLTLPFFQQQYELGLDN